MNQKNLFDTLKSKPVEELRDLARKSGLTPHHRAKPETLARQIVEATAPKPPKAEAPRAEKPAARLLTEDEVRDILKPYPNISVRFPGDGTFIMSNGKAEESLHLTTPVGVILRHKAPVINRGDLRPVSMDEAARRGVANAACMG